MYGLLSLICYFGIIPKNVHAASFSISNTTPQPAENITINGSGLTPNQEYYLFVDSAGTSLSYSDTTFNGEGAKLFSSTQSTDLQSDYPYLAFDYDDIDAIYLQFRYFDSVSATPLFTARFNDVYFANREQGITHDFTINSLGSNAWKNAVLKLDKSIGVIDGFRFIKNTSNVYLSQINRLPMFSVTTDTSGNFSIYKPAPRRSSNLTGDLNFTYKLYDPIGDSTSTVGTVTVTPIYNAYQNAKGIITFHYVVVRPETYTQNYGVTFGSWQRTLNGASAHGNWAQGYIGKIYSLLGRDDLVVEQADRFIDSQDSSGRYYSSGTGYIDNAIPAYWTLRLAYEKTHDVKYLNSMRLSMNYNLTAYNSTYGVAGHFTSQPTRFWIDQLTAFPQLAYYLGQVDNNATYKQYALNSINYAIDHMQAPSGYFYGIKDFSNDTVQLDYWDGGEVWALQGLYEMRSLVNDSTLTTKINNSLSRLADNLVNRPLTDLREDYQRTSGLAYYLFLLSKDSAFSSSQQATYKSKAEELYNLALQSMNSRSSYMNQYGLTYTTDTQSSGIFSDFFMLRILSDVRIDSTLSLSNSPQQQDNGMLRLTGSASVNGQYTVSSVQYSVNGGSLAGATSTSGFYDSTHSGFYFDFDPKANQQKDSSGNLIDGYTVKVKSTNSNLDVNDNLFYFQPFNLNSPQNNANSNTSYPAFDFGVSKQRQNIKDNLSKYQIQVKKGDNNNTTPWTTLVDNIPIDFSAVQTSGDNLRRNNYVSKDPNNGNGVYETSNFTATYSNDSSEISISSKTTSLSGSYLWKVTAVDKSGHFQDSDTRSLRVNTNQTVASSSYFPLAILNISGLGNPYISTTNPSGVKDTYNLNSLNPIFYGIASTNAKVTLSLTDQSCSSSSTDCIKTYSTIANQESRYGINIQKGDLAWSKKYTANMSVAYYQDYNELPQFTLSTSGYTTSSSQTSQSSPSSETPSPTISPTPEPTPTPKPATVVSTQASPKKNCFLFVCW